jgi:hypothetical protein
MVMALLVCEVIDADAVTFVAIDGGVIDHSMIVTGRDDCLGGPLLTYHANDQRNVTLQSVRSINFHPYGASAKYCALRTEWPALPPVTSRFTSEVWNT